MGGDWKMVEKCNNPFIASVTLTNTHKVFYSQSGAHLLYIFANITPRLVKIISTFINLV